ncbi:MAG: AI-2E family transporter [Candidatus Taylorbacteria bacterium]|nr:AI-2E family transporter [Candidatus Taylorbacteria bacterium]
MPSTRKIELSFFLLLVAITAGLSFFIFKPYLGALFVAVVFAIVFRSVHEAIVKRIRLQSIASLLTLLFLCLVILTPVALFGFFVFDDAQNLYLSAKGGTPVMERLDEAFQPVERVIRGVIPNFEINLSEYTNAALSFFVDNFGSVFTRIVGMVFQTFIMLLALFFLFRDGTAFRKYLIGLSPLTNEYDERILKRLETAIASVVKGKLLIVLIQGILASVGFWFFGIPHAVLWGALTSIAALIPAVGVAIVFTPIIIYLFVTSGMGATIGLLVFAVFVGAIDNILGPVLFERGLQMHPLLILLSVLGGLVFFGPIGFLAGPVVLSLLLALLDIYPLLFQEKKSSSL